ncbi:MAG: hypothetical protein DME63_10290 [Verrucomicrobia bacterium]|nr:MAG: hypothetical protein DME63_10290 [Verrucomicrobiota bacterium]
MNPEKAISLEGTIMSVLPGTMFRVALANDHLVLAHISGKMRKRFIRFQNQRSAPVSRACWCVVLQRRS